jgi:magnesium transporter
MEKIIDLKEVTWIHLMDPSHEEIEEIVQKYDVHDIIEEDIHSTNTQDKIDVYDDYLFLVVNFPKYDRVQGKYFANEFNIILGKKFIVTITNYDTNHIDTIKKQFQDDLEDKEKDEEYKLSPYYVLYRVLDVMYDKTLNGLNKFVRDLHALEDQLFQHERLNQKLLAWLLMKRRNSIFLKHLMLPQAEILQELHHATVKFYGGDLDVYFEDLEYKMDKVMRAIETISENASSLASTYNALANIQTNEVISMLTIFTVMMGIFAVITGFYGMNIDLPGQEHPLMFAAILIALLGIGWLLVLWARRRGRF